MSALAPGLAAGVLWIDHPTARAQGGAPRVTVSRTGSTYATAAAVRPGPFTTGQPASIVLAAEGFNRSGGPLALNHPTGLATDGRRLLVTDRWNNRVLVWKTAPTGNTPPDLVLGQPSFETNDPGTGRDQLNWPGNVTITPAGGVAVTDTNNDRILLWNRFPERSGAPADLTLNLPALGRGGPGGPTRLSWPWGVWSDGHKLVVVATHGASVLIWNRMPDRDDQAPDLILRPQEAGTPRNVTSDGQFLAVSDHNNRLHNRPATLVWRTFPTREDQQPDFRWTEWLKGTITPEKRLVAAGIRSIFLWNRLPSGAEADADVVLQPASYRNGDGPDAVVAGGRLYVCNYNGNNILGWNALPTRDNQPPDFSVGSDRPDQDTWSERFRIQNPVLATDGVSLIATSDFDRKMFLWRKLPGERGARPDLVFGLPDGPWDNALHKGTLVLGGRRSLLVWRRLPLQGEQPDAAYAGGIGSVAFQEITGVALDEQHLYVGDRQAGKIYVWKGLPAAHQEPLAVLSMERCGRLSSDGVYLAAAPFEGPTVQIWRVADLPQDRPQVLGGPGWFNLPGKCVPAAGQLFVADTSNHRVLAWDRIEDALARQAPNAILGAKNAQDREPAIGKEQLFMPGTVAYDGSRLWVGEFKFSTRILAYEPR